MAHFEIAARFEAPAAAVWRYVSWDGMPALVRGGFFKSADFPAGPQIAPGALRRVGLAEGPPFVEELLEIDESRFFYRYRLADTGSLPITAYSGVVRVTPAGAGCCLMFGHECTLVEMGEAEWREAWMGIERQVFEFIRKEVKA